MGSHPAPRPAPIPRPAALPEQTGRELWPEPPKRRGKKPKRLDATYSAAVVDKVLRLRHTLKEWLRLLHGKSRRHDRPHQVPRTLFVKGMIGTDWCLRILLIEKHIEYENPATAEFLNDLDFANEQAAEWLEAAQARRYPKPEAIDANDPRWEERWMPTLPVAGVVRPDGSVHFTEGAKATSGRLTGIVFEHATGKAAD